MVDTVFALATGARTGTITVDANPLSSGNIGERDPFANSLSQEQTNTASKTSPQLPPSQTGSTFKALVKLMTILRKMSEVYSNPEVLAADLRAWEAFLAVDLRGAVIAENTTARTPVPSQLDLKSWYGILCNMLVRIRQAATGPVSNDISAD